MKFVQNLQFFLANGTQVAANAGLQAIFSPRPIDVNHLLKGTCERICRANSRNGNLFESSRTFFSSRQAFSQLPYRKSVRTRHLELAGNRTFLSVLVQK